MKIFVCVKHVPDTAAIITVEGDAGYEESDIKFIANPYDEFAVEEAIRLVEKHGGEVVILTVGKPAAVSTIRGMLAMGAHRAILIKTDSQFLTSAQTAKALKAAMEQDGMADITFTGKMSVDTESFQTQYRLAELMNIPLVNEVSQLVVDGNRVRAWREMDAGEKQVVEMDLPCIIGMTRGLNEPRYPSFPNVMKAQKKEVKEVDIVDLGIDVSQKEVTLERLIPVPKRAGAKILEGTVEEQVDELLTILKEKEKVL